MTSRHLEALALAGFYRAVAAVAQLEDLLVLQGQRRDPERFMLSNP